MTDPQLLAHAEYVWDGREWMNKPHRELNDLTPLDVACTEHGERQLRELLDKLFFGLPV